MQHDFDGASYVGQTHAVREFKLSNPTAAIFARVLHHRVVYSSECYSRENSVNNHVKFRDANGCETFGRILLFSNSANGENMFHIERYAVKGTVTCPDVGMGPMPVYHRRVELTGLFVEVPVNNLLGQMLKVSKDNELWLSELSAHFECD